MAMDSTDDLVRAALRATDDAVAPARERLLERLTPKLVLWASTRMSALLRSRMEPEDVAQEIAGRVARSMGDFRPPTGDGAERAFYAWLWTVADHCVRDLASREGAQKRHGTPPRDEGSQTSPSHEARRRERVDVVMRALEQLEEDDREVVRLLRLQGLSADEVAALQGRSANAVRIHLCRALKRLARHLTDLGFSSGQLAPTPP
jgi:RNA polymerase sigma factor (sigma-70 family)